MLFADFERVARALWEDIPAEYKQGVDGLIVDRSALTHPDRPEIYTLGECLTEEYPSQYGGPETTRSAVVLYYGSFRAVARDAEDFDWPGEIRETVMHELQHHLESLATESGLEDVDYAVDENFKRLAGEPFDPFFYRAGEAVGAAAWQVEVDVFIERTVRSAEAGVYEFEWDGHAFRTLLPAASADVTFVYLDGMPADGDFCIVNVRRRGILATLASAFRGGLTIEEISSTVEDVT